MRNIRIVDAVPDHDGTLTVIAEVRSDPRHFAVGRVERGALALVGGLHFEAVSICRLSNEAVILGSEGEIAVLHAAHVEHLARISTTNVAGTFRQITHDGLDLYALATAQSVLRAQSPSGPWVLIDPPTSNGDYLAGAEDFEDAFDKMLLDTRVWMAMVVTMPGNFLAVGLGGDVQAWSDAGWAPLSIPTNGNFYTAMTRQDQSAVISAGKSIWEVRGSQCMERCPGEIEGDVLSIAEWDNRLWLVTSESMYVVDADWRVMPAATPPASRPFRLVRDRETLYLLCDHDVLRLGHSDGWIAVWSDLSAT